MNKLNAGFSVVEAVLAASIFALAVSAMVGALIYGKESTEISGAKQRAILLAEEGLEAARNIRDSGFSNLAVGIYGLATSSNEWVLSGSSDVTEFFTRQIDIGTVDAKTKVATATVIWQQSPSRSGIVSLVTRFTNWVASGWASPIQKSSLDFSGVDDGLKIQTQGNYAYEVRDGGTPNFVIIDITNPDSPSVAGSLNLTGNPTNIFVSGNYAYVSSQTNNEELQIIDITSPVLPVLLATLNASGNENANGVYVSSNKAYLVRNAGPIDEFVIVDVSIPLSPTILGTLNLGATGKEVFISGNYAYVVSDSNTQELQVIDISNPSVPSLAGSLNLAGNDDGLSITGFSNTIILGRATSGLFLIDVSTPASPSLLGSLDVGGNVEDISIGSSNTLAFLATTNSANEFQVVDIATPSTPTLFGVLDLLANLKGVAYDGVKDRAFLASTANTEEFIVVGPQ